MGRREGTWEGGRAHGKAGGHMGRREDTWEGGRTHGKAGGHMGRRKDTWEGGRTHGVEDKRRRKGEGGKRKRGKIGEVEWGRGEEGAL